MTVRRFFLLALAASTCLAAPAEARTILLKGTVVTMDAEHRVLTNGRVLVRDGEIARIWRGKKPKNVKLGKAKVVSGGLIYPGLINLHSHPTFNVLNLWLPPTSHRAGPYDHRYEWNSPPTRPEGETGPLGSYEQRRLVTLAQTALVQPDILDLAGETVKYAEAQAVLGGETATQGSSGTSADLVLVRNIESEAEFGGRVARPEVAPRGFTAELGTTLAPLRDELRAGRWDAWHVHVAEGVRGGERRGSEPFSSRAEFDNLRAAGLLTDRTVIIHGNALERADFRAMARARTPGQPRRGGAKLVWSPLSNLLLYGQTTHVVDAIASGVTVSLGSDWTPSGSRNVLHELKVADTVLRGQTPLTQDELDRLLVDMVTVNPAKTLGWDKVGSLRAGNAADIVLVERRRGRSPYRNLIEATEREVQMVLVDGEPLAGEPKLMTRVKGRDSELVTSSCGGFSKRIDVTRGSGDERLADIGAKLGAGLASLGGDNPPPGGGPSDDTNTWSYLKARYQDGAWASRSDDEFRAELARRFGRLPDGRINLERVALAPLFTADDDFRAAVLRNERGPDGLVADATPPYALYPSNANFVFGGTNVFSAFPAPCR